MLFEAGTFVYAVLVVPAWVPSRFSGILAQSKDMHIRLIVNSRLSLGETVSVGALVSAMNWQLVQACTPGVTLPSHQDNWERVQHPPRPRVQEKHGQKVEGCQVL